MKKSNQTGSVIVGLLIGALTGSALGILLAPNKGSKTRKNIVDGAKGMAKDVKKKKEKEEKAIRRRANDIENSAKKKFEEMKENANK